MCRDILPWLFLTPGDCPPSLACPSLHHPNSSSVIGWCSLRVFPLIRTPIILGEGPTILQYDLILNLQQHWKWGHVLRYWHLGCQHLFFFLWRGDAIQHTTIYIWKYGRNKISKLGIFIFVSFLLFFFPSSLSLSFVFLLFPFSLLPSLPLSFLSHLLLIAPFFSFLISLAIVSWWGGTNRTRRHWVDVCKKRLVHSQRNMTHNEKDSLPVLLGNLTHSIMEFWRWRKI